MDKDLRGATDDDAGYSVQQTSDGGYIVAGETYSYGAGNNDVYLIKTNSLGDTLWTRTYGGANFEIGHSVQQTSDSGYIIAGSMALSIDQSDVYLIKTDSLGDTLWTNIYGEDGRDHGYSVQQTSNGGYIVTGFTDTYGTGVYDVYLMKTKSEEAGIKENITPNLFPPLLASPNPFTRQTTICYEIKEETHIYISIYNSLGQEVKKIYSSKQSPGIHFVTWDGIGESGELSAGTYILTIKKDNKKEDSLKLMLIR